MNIPISIQVDVDMQNDGECSEEQAKPVTIEKAIKEFVDRSTQHELLFALFGVHVMGFAGLVWWQWGWMWVVGLFFGLMIPTAILLIVLRSPMVMEPKVKAKCLVSDPRIAGADAAIVAGTFRKCWPDTDDNKSKILDEVEELMKPASSTSVEFDESKEELEEEAVDNVQIQKDTSSHTASSAVAELNVPVESEASGPSKQSTDIQELRETKRKASEQLKRLREREVLIREEDESRTRRGEKRRLDAKNRREEEERREYQKRIARERDKLKQQQERERRERKEFDERTARKKQEKEREKRERKLQFRREVEAAGIRSDGIYLETVETASNNGYRRDYFRFGRHGTVVHGYLESRDAEHIQNVTQETFSAFSHQLDSNAKFAIAKSKVLVTLHLKRGRKVERCLHCTIDGQMLHVNEIWEKSGDETKKVASNAYACEFLAISKPTNRKSDTTRKPKIIPQPTQPANNRGGQARLPGCSNHPHREAIGNCFACNAPVCGSCGEAHAGQVACSECLSMARSLRRSGPSFGR